VDEGDKVAQVEQSWGGEVDRFDWGAMAAIEQRSWARAMRSVPGHRLPISRSAYFNVALAGV